MTADVYLSERAHTTSHTALGSPSRSRAIAGDEAIVFIIWVE